MDLNEIIRTLKSQSLIDYNAYQAELQALEEKRLKTIAEVKKKTMLIVGMVVFTFAFAKYLGLLAVLAMFYVLIKIDFRYLHKPGRIKAEAKKKLLAKVLAELDMSYNSEMDWKKIKPFGGLSLLPSDKYSKIYAMQDEVKGKINGIDFQFLEAMLTEEYAPHMLFIKVGFYKDFDGITIATNDLTEAGNKLTSGSRIGERVKLEDPAFEKKFAAYSTDQIEARYLLTPAFMKRVSEVSDRNDIYKLRLAFHKKNILISVQSHKNLFEGDEEFVNSPEYIKSLQDDLILVFEIIRDIGVIKGTKI